MYGDFLPFDIPLPLLLVILAWTLFWKGKALWASARNNQLYWFIALLVINTLGILEIAYLVLFKKKAPRK